MRLHFGLSLRVFSLFLRAFRIEAFCISFGSADRVITGRADQDLGRSCSSLDYQRQRAFFALVHTRILPRALVLCKQNLCFVLDATRKSLLLQGLRLEYFCIRSDFSFAFRGCGADNTVS